MRKVLFRGKRVDNGEWVYGAYFFDGRRHYIITAINDKDHAMYGCRSTDVTLFIVIPETVGQYTGLTDKKGSKIFEGDVVKDPGNIIFFVEWQPFSASYQISNAMRHYLFCMRYMDMFEVIGNIHDDAGFLNAGKLAAEYADSGVLQPAT